MSFSIKEALNIMNKDELLIAQLEDKYNQAKDYYMITSGDFLDAHERKVAEKYFISKKIPFADVFSEKLPGGEIRCLFYGGYPDAERCIPVFVPDYICIFEETDDLHSISCTGSNSLSADKSHTFSADKSYVLSAEISGLLKIIRTSLPKHGRVLSHRDYLGSLLSLGIDRGKTGDILVRTETVKNEVTFVSSSFGETKKNLQSSDGTIEKSQLPEHTGETKKNLAPGADIIVCFEIADFIRMNYARAGRRTFESEVLDIEALHVVKSDASSKTDTLASLRLDCIVASAFGVSRAKAADAIRTGAISVNSVETIKPDYIIEEKDKIVFRRHGKAVIASIGGKSRKDRIYVTFEIYK